MTRPHDKLFREVFSCPEHAADLLRAALPAELAQAIDWQTLARVQGSFVGAEMREHHADLLRRESGSTAWLPHGV